MKSAPDLSTVTQFATTDMHRALRDEQSVYPVTTVSLLDLLRDHDAPHEIDYLSIDTEGSELEILSTFDFSSYRFAVITVEHNFTEAREGIRELLTSQGYIQKLEAVSFVDDWYVREG